MALQAALVKQLISPTGTKSSKGYTLLEVLIVLGIASIAFLAALFSFRPALDRADVRSAGIDLVADWERAVLTSAETGVLQQFSIGSDGASYSFQPSGFTMFLADGLTVSETEASILFARPSAQPNYIGVNVVDRSVEAQVSKNDAVSTVFFSWPTGAN